jgi:hypothetical protein
LFLKKNCDIKNLAKSFQLFLAKFEFIIEKHIFPKFPFFFFGQENDTLLSKRKYWLTIRLCHS